MKALLSLAAALTLVILTTQFASADEKFDKAKLVGAWKVVKSEVDVPKGAKVEFTKDGKFTMSHPDENGKVLKLVGTYTVDADKINTIVKFGNEENKETHTIKSLSDDKLVVVDENNKKFELEKVK
jgi:uncharacterized protein (TIGR03066 family)